MTAHATFDAGSSSTHRGALHVIAGPGETLRSERTPAERDLVAVVRRAADGDAAAWTVLVTRYDRLVRAVARAHRLSHHDTDDVVQNTWLQLFEHIGMLRDPGALPGWLWMTARRGSLKMLRVGSRETLTDEPAAAEAEASAGPDAQAEAAERRVALRRALDELSPRQRALMLTLLAHPDGSYEEIGAVLGMPVGSIGPTRARCLERLRRDPCLAGMVHDAA